MTATPTTLYEKIWQRHEVTPQGSSELPTVLYIDLHLIHEVTSPQAFAELNHRGLTVRRPGQTVATMDHSTPTLSSSGGLPIIDALGAAQLERLEINCRAHGVPIFPLGHEHQGIVHVIGPELGLTRPGATIVCGDSHTSTHGAFGALAFGIGTSEVGHVLATQCLLQRRSKTLEIHYHGKLPAAATAKDLILATIAELGIDGGTGHVIEYTGEAIRALNMEGRMTVCNMSIEAGARAGLIAPDETTVAYLEGRPFAPSGTEWEAAVDDWTTFCSDPGATFDRRVEINVGALEPMITWGTHPGTAIPITGKVPAIEQVEPDQRPVAERAFRYMDTQPGKSLLGRKVDVVFLGSCTNSRYSDLEAAAQVLDGRKVASGVRMLVVPGSQQIKQQAEKTGLDQIFKSAGAEWREAGCSMCLAMNGDQVGPGELALSTSNRNFEGRQGPGSRTLLASPLTAAATAVAGAVADVRDLL